MHLVTECDMGNVTNEDFIRYVRLLTEAMTALGDSPDDVVHSQYAEGEHERMAIPTAVWTKRRAYVTAIENGAYVLTVIARNPDGSEVDWTPVYDVQAVN